MNNLLLWVIFDALLFYLLILPFYLSLKCTHRSVCIRFSYHWELILLWGCLVFCIYNKTEGDYFHYEEYINEINSSRIKENSFEMPYMWLISIIGNNYFLFRLFVWGTALLIYVYTLKYIRLYNNLSISIFILFALLAFAYARASLALVIFFAGMIYCFKNWELRFYFKTLIGLLIMLLALFFHKSMFVPLLLVVLLLFIKLSKKRVLILLLISPFVVYFMNILLGDLLRIQSTFSQVNRGIYYLSVEREALGPSMLIPLALSFPSMIYPMAVIGGKVFTKKKRFVPLYIRKLFELSFLLILLSFILLFLDSGGRYLYLRIKEMAYIPFAILFSYYLIYLNPSKRVILVSLGTILLQITFYFSYAYYLKSIGSGI